MNRIYVIGIGYKPLDTQAKEIISDAGVILTSKRLFEVFQTYAEFDAVKDKIKVINNVDETIIFMKSQIDTQSDPSVSTDATKKHAGIVLLASGDPMFFGIGRRVVEEFGKDMVEILPDLSSIQAAFARIKEPWDNALLISLHGGPDPTKRRRLPYEIDDIPLLLSHYSKIAILTDRENNPAKIAKAVSESSSFNRHPSSLKMFVCERLGYTDEKIMEGSPAEIAAGSFAGPNVVIIQNTERRAQSPEHSYPAFGLKEDEFNHSGGLITKDEVRAVAIHKLRMPRSGILWDIGAGSGSISIETARLFPEIRAYAIEKDDEQIRHIKENSLRYRLRNVEPVMGAAPDTLKDLPAPDSIFIGGSGGRLEDILMFTAKLPVRTIVVNAATIGTLDMTIKHLTALNFAVDVSQVAVSRLKSVGSGSYFAALNPVYVIRGER